MIVLKEFKENGSSHIEELIREGIANGSRTATVKGNWEIASAIRIPDHFKLILDGCHLKMKDGVYSNMFVNLHHDTEEGKTIAGRDFDIAILGVNDPILDGGNYNGLSEKNASQNGLPPIWKNNLILFTNVENFEMSGFSCHNQRWWALNFIFCSHGKLHDLCFKACDIGIDQDGKIYHGLNRNHYREVLVKNADGIDLRQGCHDITIENISGFTEDDSIALTALQGRLEDAFEVEGLPKDICRVTIKNIQTAAFCTNVRLLNQGAIPLHDILIDGVFDMAEESPYMDRGIYGVRIGDQKLYGSRHSFEDETYNITIRNIRSYGMNAAVSLVGAMKNITIENIECLHDTIELEDLR